MKENWLYSEIINVQEICFGKKSRFLKTTVIIVSSDSPMDARGDESMIRQDIYIDSSVSLKYTH